ncbi:MAG: TAXI family TRAP transporter solute-binding subunit [Rhodospirillaceae bacterium]|jgi:TRAP transporter TAXI family solute receptor|nr:TAXI family TRAP transporter solute-binding subunit [Rhodospirillaceae bacterium]MBT3883268.1 TAXI family TRAP transporter solute-binding subunit [Rhodospirillaceae bacterium]MBT4117594.1 TAXI family TRAP transporter solute-binding subunit [Rhodospirillaceae bacterium]MBT4672051.1 TAXI family TRAP transporter solute-binding subunit [Rhodospirillaceae bacterium]MBT4721974.1 TAXI family TRAP transporter solute-binding subunit [Rhodospirillaceae bacterium]
MNAKMSFLAAVVATAGFAAALPADAQQAIRIGTSSVGSNFYTQAVGVGEVVNKKAGINTSVQAVGGSAATVRGLGAGKIEFGMANSFAAVTGYKGTYSFKKSGAVKNRLVVQGGANHRAIVFTKGKGVNGPKDLEGKTFIGKRRPLPELALITDAMYKVYGVDPSKVKTVGTTNTGQAIKNLVVGSVAGAAVPLGRKAGNIQKPFSDGAFTFFHPTKAKRDEMLKLLPPLIFGRTFDTDSFTGLKEEVHVFAMNTLFLTAAGTSDDTVYKVTKAIIENTALMKTYHPELANWTAANSLKNVQLPFHNGAIKYYKEIGLWTPALEATQTRLLQ